MALDDLEEHRRPIAHRLGEDLEQVTLVVVIHEDPLLAQVGELPSDLGHPLGHLVVVRVRNLQEADAAPAKLGDRADDVPRRDRDVLSAGALVELEVLVDLGLAKALRRLVDRELDAAVPGGDDLRHQRGILGRDRLVGEVDHLHHPEDPLVEVDPFLHVAELDVADDVVDREQHVRIRRGRGVTP